MSRYSPVAVALALGLRAGGGSAADGRGGTGMASGRKPNVKRRSHIARLHARGLTLSEIGRRLGVTRQAVHDALVHLRRPPHPPRSVPCAACSAPIVSAGALASDQGRALCLACLESRPGAGLGVRLKACRLAAGLTKAALARRVGVRATTIHQYEAGARKTRWRHLARLVAVLGPGLVTRACGRRIAAPGRTLDDLGWDDEPPKGREKGRK
jgi:transcriptional regulator with XRE-family HTH domain